MREQILEIIQDTEKQLIRLEQAGYHPLSRKYLHYTNKLFELKNKLNEVSK